MPGERILVVPEEPDGRQALRALLQLWGHRVHDATTADEGVIRARAFKPAMVVLDLGLGGALGVCDKGWPLWH
jgi:DNA-binding response OmpR family regulator